MLTAKEKSLLEALEVSAADRGVEIVTVEIVGAKKAPTIRVYIDTPEAVSFDELSAAQVWINEIMDKLDPFPGAYVLEVSSPGIDRPLRTLEHFQKFVGEKVVIQSQTQIAGRGKWSGKLLAVVGNQVQVDIGEETVNIDYDTIKRAQVKGAVDFNSKSS